MAARTWLGSRVLAVQAEPEATAKPRRSNSCTRASPSTYRALERHHVRQPLHAGRPATSTSATAPAADRTRSTRALASADSRGRWAAVCCHASAAASARGTHGTWPPGSVSRLASGSREHPAGPLRHDEDPDAARPAPGLGVAGQHVKGGGGGGPGRGTPGRPRRAVCPALRHTSWTCSSGWRVPTSPLACCTAAATVPGTATASARAAGSTRPCRSTGTVGEQRVVACLGGAVLSWHQDGGVLDRAGHETGAAAPAPHGGRRRRPSALPSGRTA